MPKVDLNITEIKIGKYHAYQVRVVSNKKEYSKTFKFNQYPSGEKGALIAARRWRNKTYKALDKPLPISKARKNKNGETEFRPAFFQTKLAKNPTTGVVGIHRSCAPDKRRMGSHNYISYDVSWRDYWYDGTKDRPKPRTKTFWVGREDEATTADEMVALEAAVCFRKEWEACVSKRKVFEPNQDRYKRWRDHFTRSLFNQMASMLNLSI